jgi:hypothetical protein
VGEVTRDASLIAVFAAEAGEPTPTWHTPIHPTHTENDMSTTPRAETINYLRAATVKVDGADGFLYIHHWATGWQELVFQSHEAAAQYIAVRNAT